MASKNVWAIIHAIQRSGEKHRSAQTPGLRHAARWRNTHKAVAVGTSETQRCCAAKTGWAMDSKKTAGVREHYTQ